MNAESEFHKILAALRRRISYNVGMIRCAAALHESNGDLDSAVSLLKEKGYFKDPDGELSRFPLCLDAPAQFVYIMIKTGTYLK